MTDSSRDLKHAEYIASAEQSQLNIPIPGSTKSQSIFFKESKSDLLGEGSYGKVYIAYNEAGEKFVVKQQKFSSESENEMKMLAKADELVGSALSPVLEKLTAHSFKDIPKQNETTHWLVLKHVAGMELKRIAEKNNKADAPAANNSQALDIMLAPDLKKNSQLLAAGENDMLHAEIDKRLNN